MKGSFTVGLVFFYFPYFRQKICKEKYLCATLMVRAQSTPCISRPLVHTSDWAKCSA